MCSSLNNILDPSLNKQPTWNFDYTVIFWPRFKISNPTAN